VGNNILAYADDMVLLVLAPTW